jgi:hypothetical protein
MNEKVKVTVLGRILDVTARRVQQMVKEGVIPGPKAGLYDLPACVNGYVRFLRSGGDKVDFQKIKAKHLDQRTLKLQVETSRLQGDLVPKEALQEALDRAIAQCEVAFRNLPWRLAPILARMQRNDDGEFDQKLAVQIIDRMLKDTWRHSLCQQPRPETPSIDYSDRELLALGVIIPDAKGEVIVRASVYPHEKKVKASDLLAAEDFDSFWHGPGWLESQKKLRKKGE